MNFFFDLYVRNPEHVRDGVVAVDKSEKTVVGWAHRRNIPHQTNLLRKLMTLIANIKPVGDPCGPAASVNLTRDDHIAS